MLTLHFLVGRLFSRSDQAIYPMQINDSKGNALLSALPRLNSSRPVVSLPPELLGEIFNFACLDHPSYRSGTYQTINRRVRFFISATCHSWRDIALRTPLLWRTITTCSNYSGQVYPPLSFIKLDLSRASKHPLRIRINTTGDVRPPWKELLEVFRSVSSQCQSICISGVDMHAFEEFFLAGPDNKFAPIEFTLLHALVLSGGGNHSSGNIAASLDLTLASAFRQLSISYFNIPLRLPSSNSLTRLELCWNVDFDNEISLIQHCHNLHELKWGNNVHFISTFQMSELAKVDLPYLHHLQYFINPPTPMAQSLLRSLPAPQLRYLTLMHCIIPAPNQYPNLEYLCLKPLKDEILNVLPSVPNVRELVFQGRCTKDLVRALVKRNGRGEPEMVPLLRGLTTLVDNVEWGEAILSSRNNGRPEGPGMPFVLHLYGWELRKDAEFKGFRARHPWSVDEENVYCDPFRRGNWSVVQE